MATDLITFEKTLIHGESLDISIEVPLDYLPGAEDTPQTDGSVFACSFKAENALVAERAEIQFRTGQETPPFLSVGDYLADQAKQVLSFQASIDRIRQMAVGTYVGDVMQRRSRTGPLGDQSTRVARIILHIEQGTE